MKSEYKYFIILGILLLSIIGCSKPKLSPEEEKIKSIQDNYRNKIKNEYSISNSSLSKEAAIENFLKGIAEGKGDLYSCSKEEYLDIFLPNSVDEKTLTAKMEPEKAWEITEFRRKTALITLERILKGNEFKIINLNWKRENRKLNSLNSYQLGSIDLKINKNQDAHIESIKLIIENKNQFKVCVYAQ